jgi:negative regulator of sigma E activity
VSRAQRDDWITRYHDGELGRLGRWRARRRLARDAAARAEKQRLEALGGWLRQHDGTSATPDLWPGIRAALDAAPAARPAAVPSAWRPRPDLRWLDLRWVGGGLAAAAAVALAIVWTGGNAPEKGAIRWLDARGRPLMVLQDDADATIIWVPEAPSDAGSAEGRRVAV